MLRIFKSNNLVKLTLGQTYIVAQGGQGGFSSRVQRVLILAPLTVRVFLLSFLLSIGVSVQFLFGLIDDELDLFLGILSASLHALALGCMVFDFSGDF